jgi:outer membrane protein assembly factor BamA
LKPPGKNSTIRALTKILIPTIILILLGSCRATKYVPENQYLLKKNVLQTDNKEISSSELNSFIRQRPNKKILGIRFFLGVYNLSNRDKERWPHSWLRKIGEAPVVFDPAAVERTNRQFELYMRNKGYFNARISDSLMKKGRKVTVLYDIHTSTPHRIRSISYNVEDPELAEPIQSDTVNSLLRVNAKLDVDLLQEERIRIEENLRNTGYFNFSREYVYFNADTAAGNRDVHLTLGIKKYIARISENEVRLQSHSRYQIRDVYVFTEFDPRASLINPAEYLTLFDTLSFRGMSILFKERLPVNPRVIAQSNFILPGAWFSQEDVDRTYRNFFGLRLYRLINIRFREHASNDTLTTPLLDCFIQLTPFKLQSTTLEIEGTNSSGDFGFGGNLIYQHRNFFRGAEIFDLKLKGGLETLRENESSDFRNTYEYGVESNLRIPKFLLPIRSISFIKRYNPQTNIKLAYNYQKRPDYTRTVANATFGYQWKGTEYITNIINPIEFSTIKLLNVKRDFLDRISGTILEFSYQDHLISETNYSFIFNNQEIGRAQDFVFFRWNIEFAGNILTSLHSAFEAEKVDGTYQLFGTEIAQFGRTDIDFRYYQYLSESNSLVYRFFAGAGLPYGNSVALPFEKKYFSGGANSIRAWQVRSLGPGSFYEESDRSFPNRTADIKLEANLEYRFKMFWLLEGAFFLDAGNIWAINKSDQREGAVFNPGSFYRDIALGTGFGTRFDFSFFVFRLDLGLKLRNPSEPEGTRWIPWDRKVNFSNDFAINIGIGYPF